MSTALDASPATRPPDPHVALQPPQGSLIQPIFGGLLAAVVGFAATFTIVLQGFAAVGATPAQAASGLLVLCVVQGVLSIGLSLVWREPISIVWSTPGSALLIVTGAQAGGYPAAIGAFILAGALIVAAGLIKPFGRLVAAIPSGLANAMLAGVLFEICLAPVEALKTSPTLVLPILLAWVLALRFARRFAVPIAVAVTVLIVVFVTKLPAGALKDAWPTLILTQPVFAWSSLGSLVVPLFIVTMASQNVPGLAVLHANGYKPNISKIFVATGLGSIVNAFGSGGLINLAAVTAALCAGPDAHPDPAKRYWSTIANGVGYVVLGLFAAFAAAFILASPSSLFTAVAGLALMGSFAGALSSALAHPQDRVAVAITFVMTASGASFFGIGASFWGLLAGGLVLVVERFRR
ncbi:benzoate/H(+) symporter BenE family transporter [Lichenihabitans psoromatis]|uniref:benzoate/H(+) symporter BenE family transporter n=1 Tax=Lichenihabitans psoromatis TaxID=2528642 RepID=UPI00315CF24F